MKSVSRALAALALVTLLVVGGAALFGGAVTAGDNVGLVDFHPTDGEAEPGVDVITEADPGETVVIEATLRSDGGYSGEGVKSANKTIAYDSEVLTLTDIERGPWLEQGNETDIIVESSIDNEAGRATLRQVRSPVDGGAVGEGVTVRMTFEVTEDAPPSNAYLQYEAVDLVLETDSPIPIIERERAISINGGGEERKPLADDEDDEDDDGPGITTPEGEQSDVTPEDSETPEPTDAETDDQPGFGVIAALVALLAAAGLRRQTK